MKNNIILKSFFLLCALIAGYTIASAENYNVTYSYSDLGDMLTGNYTDASSYWKVPGTAGNTATISIPITYQPTSDITLTFRIATFGSGTNPSASNTTITAVGTETSSNWSGSGVSTYPYSSSYVNGTMTITKPNSPTTLGGLNITMGVNSGVKIFRLQSLTISYTYSSGGAPTPTTYTVSYEANGGTGTMTDSNSPYEEGDEVTLLSNTFTAPEGKVWSSWSVKDESNNSISISSGKFNMPASNVTVTAQWADDPSAPQYEWVETSLSNLGSTDVFVIVGNNGNNYALSSANGTSSAPPVYAVTIANGKINTTATPVTDALKFNISGNASDGYTFYPNGSTTTFIYCTDTNNGVRVGKPNSNTTEIHTFTVSNGYLTAGFSTARYIGIYNSQDWRSYTSTTGNIANQTFSYYKRQVVSTDPVINASNPAVLAFNATEGEFGYSIDNPATGVTLNATSNSEWITDVFVDETNSKVTFSTSANPNTTQRTGTITLTYTGATDKEITITQAASPAHYTTIPALFDGATSTETPVLVTFNNWVVSGVSSNGKNIFVTDNNGNGFVIYSSTDASETYSAGKSLYGAAVECNLVLYNGFAELKNLDADDLTISDGGTVSVADIALADLDGVNTGSLVSYSNLTCTVSTSGNYTNYDLSDGTTTLRVYSTLYDFTQTPDLVDGHKYNITGIYQQYNTNNSTTKEILPRSAADIEESDVPSISLSSYAIEATAAEAQGTLTVTYVSIETSVGVEIQWFESDGTTPASEPAWIDAEINASNNVDYVIGANSGTARNAYFKVYGVDGDTNDVYSELVTITQAAYVAPPVGDQYKLYTGSLVEGDYIILYDEYAMNNTVSSKRLQYEDQVTPSSDQIITTGNGAIVWHIAPSGDYWTIYSSDMNAFAASTGTKNQAQMIEDGTDNKALWTVTIDSGTYDFVNKYNDDNNVNKTLRNNGTYGFACYATSTGAPLSLFKRYNVSTSIDLTLTAQDNGRYWATFYNSAARYTLPEGAQAFTMDEEHNLYLLGTDGSVIPMNTAVIIISDKNEITLEKSDATSAVAINGDENILRGSNYSITADNVKGTDSAYVLGVVGGKLGFYQYTGSIIPANKVYYVE